MWYERFLKVIPAIAFLFCILESLELVLIVEDMNKIEKLEVGVQNNLKALEMIVKHLEYKKINIK
ncbi:hypothetical protein JT135_05010 [Helicobacter pylori]|nr:hypothetical protein [Helicobacter pylori]